jgi:hypothetical protein
MRPCLAARAAAHDDPNLAFMEWFEYLHEETD